MYNTDAGVQGLEEALRTCSGKHGRSITQDEMLLAFNRVNVGELGLGDVRDFFSSVKGRTLDDEIEIDDIMNVLNNWR